VLGKYSPTSSPFLIQLLLLDFHDVPWAISNISTMCMRSVRRVMLLDTWMNAAWRSSFRLICMEHWPLFLWHIWHHSLKFCWYISSLILLLLGRLTVTCWCKSNVSAMLSPDMDSRTFTWCVWPLHKHRWIIMSHNLFTEIKKKRTRSKSGKQIAFHKQMTSIITLCLSVPLLTQEPSPCLRLNPKSIWWLAGGYKQG